MHISTATPALAINTDEWPYFIHIIPPTAGTDIDTIWLILIPIERVGEISLGDFTIFEIYVSRAMWTPNSRLSNIRQAYNSHNANVLSGSKCAKPYPAQIRKIQIESKIRIVRSPNRSIILPSQGWKKTPITDATMNNCAKTYAGCLNTCRKWTWRMS